jgi:hypothetical protein
LRGDTGLSLPRSVNWPMTIFAVFGLTHSRTELAVVRRALSWTSIENDKNTQQQLTQGQSADVKEKAKTNREAAERAIRSAWNHILYAEKDETVLDGKPFETAQTALLSRERPSIATSVYEKVSSRGDGLVKDTLGPRMLMAKLTSLWRPKGHTLRSQTCANGSRPTFTCPSYATQQFWKALSRKAFPAPIRNSVTPTALMNRPENIRGLCTGNSRQRGSLRMQ